MASSPYHFDHMIHKMHAENVDVILIQEINTNISHATFKKVTQASLKRLPHTQCVWAQIKNSTDHLYQPGGTALFISPPLSRHISNRHIDPLGRWAGSNNKTESSSPDYHFVSLPTPKGTEHGRNNKRYITTNKTVTRQQQ